MNFFKFEVLSGERVILRIPRKDAEYRTDFLGRNFGAKPYRRIYNGRITEVHLSGAEDFKAMIRFLRGTPNTTEVGSRPPA